MTFQIANQPVFTTLHVTMEQGEQMKAEAGAMLSMSPAITLQAKSSGKGILGTLKTAVSGESIFASLFTAENGPGEVVLAPANVGDIMRFDLNGETLFAEGGSYLAGAAGLEISTQGSFKALVSGEGLFLQKITGTGPLFLTSYGAILEKTLQPGETFIVDTGHLLAFQETVQYKVKKASKGIFSSLASGEGLVCEYTGPGKVWMQSRNLPAFAEILSKFIPTQS